MSKFRIGLVGVGDILDCHLCAIEANPDYKLMGICRRSKEKLDKQADELGVKGYVDYRAMLEDKPDIVLISLPHDLHYRVAIDAIKAGCHVLIEKPIAIGIGEINDIISFAGKAGKAVIVTESSYWLPTFLTARNVVQSGVLGKMLFGNFINHRFYYNDSRPEWFLDSKSSGGGQFINIGVHRIAAVRCIIGDDYEEVAVMSSTHRIHPKYDIETATQAFVSYAGGQSITYEECGYHHPPIELKQGLHFVFEQGMLGITNGYVWTSDRDGNVTKHNLVSEHPGGAYGGIYRQMLNAIEGKEHYPTVYHCAKDARIALASYFSSENNKAVDLQSPEWQII